MFSLIFFVKILLDLNNSLAFSNLPLLKMMRSTCFSLLFIFFKVCSVSAQLRDAAIVTVHDLCNIRVVKCLTVG